MELSEIIRVEATLKDRAAWAILQAAWQKALELGIAVNIAVADHAAHIKASMRMDAAPLLSYDIAVNKAYTAAAFGLPTEEWYAMISGDPALLHGIVHTPRLVIFGGGLPLQVNGSLVGAIGVSGGTSEQDAACAQAGAQALRQLLAMSPGEAGTTVPAP